MTKIIVNSRIYLDLIQDQDLDRFVELANHPMMHQNLGDTFPYPYTLEDAQRWLDHTREERTIEEGDRHRGIYIDDIYAGNLGWIRKGEGRKKHNYYIGYRLG